MTPVIQLYYLFYPTYVFNSEYFVHGLNIPTSSSLPDHCSNSTITCYLLCLCSSNSQVHPMCVHHSVSYGHYLWKAGGLVHIHSRFIIRIVGLSDLLLQPLGKFWLMVQISWVTYRCSSPVPLYKYFPKCNPLSNPCIVSRCIVSKQ